MSPWRNWPWPSPGGTGRLALAGELQADGAVPLVQAARQEVGDSERWRNLEC